MIASVDSGSAPPSGNETVVIVIPEVIELFKLSLNVPIFSKTFSQFAPVPAEVVYFTLMTSPFDSDFPTTPSPNNISGI